MMEERIRKAMRLIQESYSNSLSINEITRRVGLGRTRFESLFKAETGTTPMQYLKQVRIEQAKQWLLDDARSIKQVARAVGYKSLSHFCHDFKKTTGRTPTEFRQLHTQ
jgi:AraC-like DNA-binding protein